MCTLSSSMLARITTAVEVGVPKLGNCLEMYTCAQASAQLCTACVQAWTFLAHWSYCLATPCTLEVYTCLGTAWARVHFQAVSKLGHSIFYSSVPHCTQEATLVAHCQLAYAEGHQSGPKSRAPRLPSQSCETREQATLSESR